MWVFIPLFPCFEHSSKLFRPVLTIRAFLKRRKQFRELLARHTNLTYSRYWRLVAVASIDFCLTIPLSIKAIVTNAVLCPRPLADWVDLHTQRTLIILVTKELAAEFPGALSAIEFNRWSAVLSAFVFFGLFGFADEAMKNYHLLASVIIKPLEYITSTQSTTTSKSYADSPPYLTSLHLLTLFSLQYGRVWY